MANDKPLREKSETQMVDYGTRMRKRAEKAEAQLAELQTDIMCRRENQEHLVWLLDQATQERNRSP